MTAKMSHVFNSVASYAKWLTSAARHKKTQAGFVLFDYFTCKVWLCQSNQRFSDTLKVKLQSTKHTAGLSAHQVYWTATCCHHRGLYWWHFISHLTPFAGSKTSPAASTANQTYGDQAGSFLWSFTWQLVWCAHCLHTTTSCVFPKLGHTATVTSRHTWTWVGGGWKGVQQTGTGEELLSGFFGIHSGYKRNSVVGGWRETKKAQQSSKNHQVCEIQGKSARACAWLLADTQERRKRAKERKNGGLKLVSRWGDKGNFKLYAGNNTTGVSLTARKPPGGNVKRRAHERNVDDPFSS